jgi:myo-inositol-1(or 4)-monophosphatase
MLDTAIEAARRAGQAVAEHYPAARNVTVKGYRDVVTEVDYIAERIVLDTIRARFPDHTILSEEAGESAPGSRYTWIVDPIDGTTNYSRRLPICSVSVGLLEEDVPIVGAIYDPLRDQMFAAHRGQGAQLDGTPIHASRVETLADSVVGLDWGHADEVRARTLAHVNQVVPWCRTVRGLGSAALALAYVAAGWLDAYFNLGMKPWDTAAGTVLVAEAGGRITTTAGGPYRVDIPECLATNGLIHDQILFRLREGARAYEQEGQ